MAEVDGSVGYFKRRLPGCPPNQTGEKSSFYTREMPPTGIWIRMAACQPRAGSILQELNARQPSNHPMRQGEG